MREGKMGVMVYVPVSLHRRFKVRLAEMGLTQSSVIQGMMEHFVNDVTVEERQHEPEDRRIEPAQV